VQLICANEQSLAEAARTIIGFAGNQALWFFYGQMGAGKTTLIKAIADEFGVEDIVHSPSFNLVNEYRNAAGQPFYHFDFYRIKNETEALDIGVDEYFDSGNLCFVEWPEKIPGLTPVSFFQIEITIADDMTRHINLCHHGK
jgi:tRNA threonylcarbamoyladenosine biosynthesis protein TsaE